MLSNNEVIKSQVRALPTQIEGLFGFLGQQNNDAWTEFHRALDFGEIPPKLGGSLHENLHESFQIDRQSRVNKPKLEFRFSKIENIRLIISLFISRLELSHLNLFGLNREKSPRDENFRSSLRDVEFFFVLLWRSS